MHQHSQDTLNETLNTFNWCSKWIKLHSEKGIPLFHSFREQIMKRKKIGTYNWFKPNNTDNDRYLIQFTISQRATSAKCCMWGWNRIFTTLITKRQYTLVNHTYRKPPVKYTIYPKMTKPKLTNPRANKFRQKWRTNWTKSSERGKSACSKMNYGLSPAVFAYTSTNWLCINFKAANELKGILILFLWNRGNEYLFIYRLSVLAIKVNKGPILGTYNLRR